MGSIFLANDDFERERLDGFYEIKKESSRFARVE